MWKSLTYYLCNSGCMQRSNILHTTNTKQCEVYNKYCIAQIKFWNMLALDVDDVNG